MYLSFYYLFLCFYSYHLLTDSDDYVGDVCEMLLWRDTSLTVAGR